ncbi:MAG TPA: hypothetical protein GXX75_17225 [Clostridiales bacterium]|nr:hypothetical protein [Clostridiales bacterium]
MKQKRSLLPFYIIIIPVAALAVLLNSGILQQHVKAVSIGEDYYTCAAYNYYYYNQYNDFIDENSGKLEELGFDIKLSEEKQQYNDEITWQEYFSTLAEQKMLEVTALNLLAEEKNYAFKPEELKLKDEKMSIIKAKMLEEGFGSLHNYLISYYNNGMTEEIFEEQLMNEIKADAYKAALREKVELTQPEIDEYIRNHPELQRICEVRIIGLYPAKDRFSGDTQDQQWEDLSEKMSKLIQRYLATDHSEEAFADLAIRYSDMEETAACGGLYQVDMASEEAVTSWCFEEGRKKGDIGQVKTLTGEYLLYFLDGDGAIAGDKAEGILRETKADLLASAFMDQYLIKKNGFGMKLSR